MKNLDYYDYKNEIKLIEEIYPVARNVDSSVWTQYLLSAENKINNYIGWIEFDENYFQAKITLAIAYYKYAQAISGNADVSSYTEGARSETYNISDIVFDADGLTPAVKAMLPRPYIKVF